MYTSYSQYQIFFRATLKENVEPDETANGTTVNAIRVCKYNIVLVSDPTRTHAHNISHWFSFGRTLINPLLNPMDTPRLILSVRRAHAIDYRVVLCRDIASRAPYIHNTHRA